MERNFDDVVRGYQMILDGLGINSETNPHFKDTPRRAAKAMFYELCAGLTGEAPKMTTFPVEGDQGMIISRDIPVRSFCAHHLLPFVGVATVAYIPTDKMLGLSKLTRAVEYISRRPQVQEELTNGVADFLCEVLGFEPPGLDDGPEDSPPCGVGVVLKCRHMCMELRGVSHPSDVVTSALRGEFLKPEVRSEFLTLSGIK